MKVEVTIEEKKEVIKYPCLMILDEGKQGVTGTDIVLFTSPKEGTVIRGDFYATGHYYSNWHMPHFVPFNGQVTLYND